MTVGTLLLGMYLKVAKLSELFTAVIELADKWLDLPVYKLMSPDIPPLCKTLTTDIGRIRAFAV